jgi:putative PIN family toxin of toxin-antitoxin system
VRIVLDTNVLLAALGTRGLCEALVAACLESHDLVTSDHILAELREHLVKAFRLTGQRADEVAAFVREHSEVVSPSSAPPAACRNSSDLPVLGTAVAGNADLLVTGDKDLLDLKRFEGVPIVTPRDCYGRLVGSGRAT